MANAQFFLNKTNVNEFCNWYMNMFRPRKAISQNIVKKIDKWFYADRLPQRKVSHWTQKCFSSQWSFTVSGSLWEMPDWNTRLLPQQSGALPIFQSMTPNFHTYIFQSIIFNTPISYKNIKGSVSRNWLRYRWNAWTIHIK